MKARTKSYSICWTHEVDLCIQPVNLRTYAETRYSATRNSKFKIQNSKTGYD